MEPPNINSCIAVKNKKKNCMQQCPNRRLGGCEFCGKHNNPFQLRYDVLYQTNQQENSIQGIVANTINTIIDSISPKEKRKRVWSIAQVCNNPPNEETRTILCKFLTRHSGIDSKTIKSMNIEDLHQTSLRIYRVKREQAEIEKKKKILFKNGMVKPIQRLIRIHLKRINKAVATIQSILRVRLVRVALGPGFYKPSLLNNEDDMCNSIPLKELHPSNFHSFDINGIVYGVDCRSFDKLLKSGYNEIYGCKIIDDVIRRFNLRKKIFPNGHIDEEILILTNEQQLNGKLVELINLFDQYKD